MTQRTVGGVVVNKVLVLKGAYTKSNIYVCSQHVILFYETKSEGRTVTHLFTSDGNKYCVENSPNQIKSWLNE